MNKFTGLGLALALAAITSTTSVAAPPPGQPTKGDAGTRTGTDLGRFKQLLDDDWQWGLQDQPTFATSIGDYRWNDRWADQSLAAFEKRRAHAHELQARLDKINVARLPESAQLDAELFAYNLKQDLAGERFHGEYLPLNQMHGVHSAAASLARIAPKATVKQVEDFIARLRAYPTLIEQNIVLMKKGMELGLVPPKITMRDVPKLIGNQITTDVTKSPIYETYFAELPPSIPTAEQERLRTVARAVITDAIFPALAKLRSFVEQEYVPHTRDSIGLSQLPDGKAWYVHRAQNTTTTELTPEQIHDLGLSEVKRIRAEMEKVAAQAGFDVKGKGLPAFFQTLRTDPRFYYADKQQLIMGYRDLAKRIDAELPRLFGTLPRLPYGVSPVPAYSEKTQTTAYYEEGSPEAGRSGVFFANTYDLKARPKWEMEALTLHEAMPGHHLQIARAQELEGVPPFRRYGGYTAYVEGWGLYSESLGAELGLYKDPYAHFGQLTYEMWRAIRLVVDTGMHWKGWTREQALQFFRDNAGKSEHDITVEVDRYIVWPGQALGYKVGELRIKALRKKAAETLGTAFDVRAFHDQVLGAGPLPLKVLELRIDRWITAVQKATASAPRLKQNGG